MDKKNNEFLKRLLATFAIEAEERINNIYSGLMNLEKNASPEKEMEEIEIIFREAHSLKGASRAVNLIDIEKICQSMESIFASLKCDKIILSPGLIKLLFSSVDLIQKLLSNSSMEESAEDDLLITELMLQLEKGAKGEIFTTPANVTIKNENESTNAEKGTLSSNTVRIPTAKLDSLLLQAEELIPSTLSFRQSAVDLKNIFEDIISFERQFSKFPIKTLNGNLKNQTQNNNRNISLSLLENETVKLKDFAQQSNEFIKSIGNKLNTLIKRAEQDQYYLRGRVTNLLDGIKNSLMMPFSSIVEQYPNIIRKMAVENGKEIELAIQGEMIEVDRRILEEMKDPLLHLIRNCLDHGIEKPEERKLKKKSSKGTITLSITHKEGNKFEILISDDGAGISLDSVKSAALKLGVITPEEINKMEEKEVLSLIFRSGISTSSIITDISGRGVGLAIVRDTIEKLNGIISIETKQNEGTTFRIILPLKLANFLGVLVRSNEKLFIFPSSGIERVMRLKKKLIITIENKEAIQVEGQTVSLVRLNDVMNLPQVISKQIEKEMHSVIVNIDEKRIAFLVDEILNEQEVLIKNFNKPLLRVKNILGAAILGNGELVPVINLQDLVKSSLQIKNDIAPVKTAISSPAKEETIRKSILLAEDSITARALLKNILEGAGFNVKTAVDGVDAFTELRENKYDIVVSDVEMPRMNGFDLTLKIRSDERLSDLPVVLVTALNSREDREKGIDAGANAYIVKSSFEQSNLLEVINRLI
ncbi:MAG: hybrid sensor histidine kinase/response regulator [Ignavibacteriaceae bacterium]